MQRFKVWLRPMGTECKVRIDGAGNASWLQFQLTEKGIECGASVLLKGSAQVVFHVLYPPQFADDDLRHFIAGIPEVELMLDPA